MPQTPEEKLKHEEKLRRDREKKDQDRIRKAREAEKRRLSYTKIGVNE